MPKFISSHKFYSPLYTERAGQSVKIVRELSEAERDPEVGRMFVIEFDDGVRLDVFEDEIIYSEDDKDE